MAATPEEVPASGDSVTVPVTFGSVGAAAARGADDAARCAGTVVVSVVAVGCDEVDRVSVTDAGGRFEDSGTVAVVPPVSGDWLGSVSAPVVSVSVGSVSVASVSVASVSVVSVPVVSVPVPVVDESVPSSAAVASVPASLESEAASAPAESVESAVATLPALPPAVVEFVDGDEVAFCVPLSVPVCDAAEPPLVVVEASFDDADDVEESALAMAGDVATITPIPRAAASAPTRPTYRPYPLTCVLGALIGTPPTDYRSEAPGSDQLAERQVRTCRT
ncbi:hypothetical protein [Mycolicibacterium chubuense]|uniref:hypothetical protein n=1 Tax=Mycolicibacterium chubuense TaxID=1800 RepID=UPI00030C72BD|nr:hypothetical protein [Mycolicibacterium chubuense]